MPKAIFHRDCEIRSRTRNVAWSIKAAPNPQTFPRDCIDLAVEQGAATRVSPKRRDAAANAPEETGD